MVYNVVKTDILVIMRLAAVFLFAYLPCSPCAAWARSVSARSPAFSSEMHLQADSRLLRIDPIVHVSSDVLERCDGTTPEHGCTVISGERYIDF